MAKALLAAKQSDLDQLQIDRLSGMARSEEAFAYDQIFLSDKVIETINAPKIFLYSYDLNKVLTALPFWQNVYVGVCPACFDRSSVSSFATLTERGAIVPVLVAPYRDYVESVQHVLRSHNHISMYEFDLFREYELLGRASSFRCGHCVDKQRKRLSKLAGRNVRLHDEIEGIFHNLHPYSNPESLLLDRLESAVRTKKPRTVSQLYNLSLSIRSTRSMQALEAPILLDDDDISGLPKGVSSEIDEARGAADELNIAAQRGLGIRIPTGIPIEEYIEIAAEFRPEIERLTRTLVVTAKASRSQSARETLIKNIMKMNSEIERLKGLKRHAVLECAVGFLNKPMLATALLLGALGHWSGVGCYAAGLAAKKVAPGAINVPEKQLRRVMALVQQEFQPLIDQAVSFYLGADTPAVSFLSIRRRVANRRAA
jgi:hypothetical protein